ncbi:MAG: NAD(P)H-quinone oxidoreductase, partial [Marinobacter sp.]
GQEITLLTMMMPLLHHGMVLCGLPYTDKNLSETTTGGTPYGPTHWAGTAEQQPLSKHEKALCQLFGERLANLALKLAD